MMLTNEERRVPTYTAGGGQPTVPGRVNASTRLEDLNLNWRESELPEKERTKHVHRLHPYLGKYIPQLVEIFLRKYFKQGQTVLDPFCGSGTTLVQANELNINSVGYDVSAFNILLCRVKTAEYDTGRLRGEILDILERVTDASRSATTEQTLSAAEQEPNPATGNRYLLEWFAPAALRELLTYKKYLETGDYRYRDVMKVILSRSARSARLTTHFDLDFPKRPQTVPYHCYKHSRTCEPTTGAVKFLKRYSLDTLKRIEEFGRLRTRAAVSIKHEDSRTADFPEVDGVITSPPYVGLIDYHEQHSYGYHLLGLNDKRELEIGAAAGGASKRAQVKYQDDIATVFRRAAERMPGGGRMIVIAADRSDLYGKIAGLAGMKEEAVINRHVNRRTGRRSGEFFESVFVWRKE